MAWSPLQAGAPPFGPAFWAQGGCPGHSLALCPSSWPPCPHFQPPCPYRKHNFTVILPFRGHFLPFLTPVKPGGVLARFLRYFCSLHHSLGPSYGQMHFPCYLLYLLPCYFLSLEGPVLVRGNHVEARNSPKSNFGDITPPLNP